MTNVVFQNQGLSSVRIHRETPRYGKILKDMTRYDQIWQDMTRYDKIWQDMTRYGKIWQDMTRYGKIWQNMARYGWYHSSTVWWRLKSPICGDERRTNEATQLWWLSAYDIMRGGCQSILTTTLCVECRGRTKSNTMIWQQPRERWKTRIVCWWWQKSQSDDMLRMTRVTTWYVPRWICWTQLIITTYLVSVSVRRSTDIFHTRHVIAKG